MTTEHSSQQPPQDPPQGKQPPTGRRPPQDARPSQPEHPSSTQSPLAADRLRDEYLAELDRELTPLPYGTAAELRSAISAELIRMPLPELQYRIDELGTPASIARAALESGHESGTNAVVAMPNHPARVTDTRGFAIAAALTLGFGGFVVPIVGWIVGIFLVSLSSAWKTREKLWAFVTPLFVPIILVPVTFLFSYFEGTSEAPVSGNSGFHGPSAAGFSPVGLATPDLIWSTTLATFIIVPFTAGWLLFKLRKRTISG